MSTPGKNKQPAYKGIPPEINLAKVRAWVKERVSAKRFAHIEGVAEVALRLAQASGADPYLAELAGWLHDACKEMKAKELVQEARKYRLKLHPLEMTHGYLLHGPVAAKVVKKKFGITNKEVLNAISEHTLGAVPMARLSEVVFLADCLDKTRPDEYTGPIWRALDIDGACDLQKAIVVACDSGIAFLLADGKPIHPRTIDVRNHYLALIGYRSGN